jgi:hypothetical protein
MELKCDGAVESSVDELEVLHDLAIKVLKLVSSEGQEGEAEEKRRRAPTTW